MLDLLITITGVTFLVTQVILPLLLGGPYFPIFRIKIDTEEDKERAILAAREEEARQKLLELVRKASAKKVKKLD